MQSKLIHVSLVLVTSAAAACSEPPAVAPETDTGTSTRNVVSGRFPLYHTQANIPASKPRNDASGAAFLPGTKRLLVADDGGDDANPEAVPFYAFELEPLLGGEATTATELPAGASLAGSMPARHRDIETLTTDGSWLYAMSSLPAPAERADEAFRNFSRFRLEGDEIVSALTIQPREAIIEALARPTADPWFAAWLARWRDKTAKAGGLQVEALTQTSRAGELLVALRSPHYSEDYLTSSTRTGRAMLVQIQVGEFSPDRLGAAVHATLDLGGLGFRGMDYSSTARGYFITAGAVEAGFDYDFFFWNGEPEAAPIRLSEAFPEFAKLCRPESVAEIEIGGRKYLLILSEDSGAICEDPRAPYNYLLIELNAAVLGLLR